MLVVFVLVVVVVIAQDAYLKKFPLLIQRESAYILWLLVVGLSGLFGGYAFKQLNPLVTLSVISLSLILAIYYTQPIYTQIAEKELSKNATFQTTLYSCGCASLSTLLKQLHVGVSEREACRVSDTTRDGTNPGQIRYTLAHYHIRFQTLQRKKQLGQLSAPALLFVDRRGGYENHTIVLLKKRGERFIVFDPMEGWQNLSEQKLQKIWHGNGVEVESKL